MFVFPKHTNNNTLGNRSFSISFFAGGYPLKRYKKKFRGLYDEKMTY